MSFFFLFNIITIFQFFFVTDAQCELLQDISNGSISSNMGIYGDVVTYHCDEGFQLNGTERRVCQSDKKWSDTAPTCVGMFSFNRRIDQISNFWVYPSKNLVDRVQIGRDWPGMSKIIQPTFGLVGDGNY